MPGKRYVREKMASRACDACKVRKIRCSGTSPCARCTSSGIACTFNSSHGTRGPKKLRSSTIAKISKSQQEEQPVEVLENNTPTLQGTDVSEISNIIDIYNTRLYPIWPIVDSEELKEALKQTPVASHQLQLANAVALATVAQLKLLTLWNCASALSPSEEYSKDGSLNSLQVSFFLHIYYENIDGGGARSLLYLREAITIAQILRLEHETTYGSFSEEDQMMYRRVFWLLFISERGVTLLHKLPPVLKPNILLPWYGVSDDMTVVLPDFLKLISLFLVLDQSGIFDILKDSDSCPTKNSSFAKSCLEQVQQKLQQSARDMSWGVGNDVQRADVVVTRHWMRAVLWRTASRFGVSIPMLNPVDVADDFLSAVAEIPSTALESHGQTLEFKTFEIATAVIDSLTMGGMAVNASETRSQQVLHGLSNVLLSSRGGNDKLLSLLQAKMQTVVKMPITRQPSDVGLIDDILAFTDEAWRFEDFFPQLNLAAMPSPSRNRSPVNESQQPWLPLDFLTFTRPMSPLALDTSDPRPTGGPL